MKLKKSIMAWFKNKISHIQGEHKVRPCKGLNAGANLVFAQMLNHAAIIFLAILLFSNSLIAFSSDLQDINTLVIYIQAKEYTGKKFLNDDGMLYTSLNDLKKALNVTYELAFDGKENKLIIHDGEEKIEYKYALLKKEEKIYVPLTTFCQSLGYMLKYDEKTNTLEISKENTQNITPDAGKTELLIRVCDRKFDNKSVIIKSLDDKKFNLVETIKFFNPLKVYLAPGNYTVTIKAANSDVVIKEETIQVIEGINMTMELK